ncbi:hypothetical protein QVD17_41615 [Tagetes erecta]|uniref:Uncharacterized protein n=1 Tax=Tagetes erecta TaxID=13708 RepID=A0AAD8NFQ2_TARER|nr:hypothetical protein QVD17_41615 [Tagetes erecta]
MIARPPQADDNDVGMKMVHLENTHGRLKGVVVFSSVAALYSISLGLQLLCSERVRWSGGCLRIKELRTHHLSGNRLLSCIGVALSAKARLPGNDSSSRHELLNANEL